jgi:hypothetical protein
MTDKPGRGTNPFDPTAERTSDPKSGDRDVVGNDPGPGETPRRHEERPEENEAVMPSDDSSLKTQI